MCVLAKLKKIYIFFIMDTQIKLDLFNRRSQKYRIWWQTLTSVFYPTTKEIIFAGISVPTSNI